MGALMPRRIDTAARLVPLASVADEHKAAERRCWLRDPDRFRWARAITTPFEYKVPVEGDWHKVARAVWQGSPDDGRVLGVCIASVDRTCLQVYELYVISYEPGPSLAFARALVRFVDGLIATHTSVRWSYIDGNPVGPKWVKFAKSRGGDVIGHFPLDMLIEGRLHDRVYLAVKGAIEWRGPNE